MTPPMIKRTSRSKMRACARRAEVGDQDFAETAAAGMDFLSRTPPFPPSTFICFHLFFLIRTFQWVTGEENKKIRRPLNSRLRLCATSLNAQLSSFRLAAWRAARTPRSYSVSEKGIA
jgi:hypothetical protein